jgi:hypothetical protein
MACTGSSDPTAQAGPVPRVGAGAAPRLEAVELSQAEARPDVVLGRRLEAPAEGSLVAPRVCKIIGWALPRSGRVLAVELLNGTRLLQRAQVDVSRPDVRERFPQAEGADVAGFRATVNMLAVRNGVEINVRAVLSADGWVPLGTVRLHRRRDAVVDQRGWPLVSVVIPCFDQAHYLHEAIESVLAQTHPELEIVVVDDSSEDNTREVAARYPGVRCISQVRCGVAAGRNLGLTQSEGEFVVFLDADDRLLPRALEVGIEALERRPDAALAAGACRDIAGDGQPLPSKEQPLVERDHYPSLLRDSFIWSGSAVMHRRGALEAIGGFNEVRRAADDYELHLRIARRFPILCHHEVVTEYRRHGSNQTRDPALTLASELSVLRSQRASLRGAAERAARRAGIRRARSEHGKTLAGEVRSHLQNRRWGKAWSRGLLLARWDPRRLLSLVGAGRYRRC